MQAILVFLVQRLLPFLVRAFIFQFIIKWAKVFLTLAAKILLFWIVYKVVKNWLLWAFGQATFYLKQYLPSPNDPWVQSVMRAAKCAEVWFPWEFLGQCCAAILLFQMWCIFLKLTVKIYGYALQAVDWIMQHTSAN